MDSQTNLPLATVATEATAGSAMGFLIGYRVRQIAAIMLKVTAVAVTLLAIKNRE